MRHLIYILMIGLCFNLTAQTRQNMQEEEQGRERDSFAAQDLGLASASSFFHPGYDALLIGANGTVVIPKLTFGPEKGEFVILPFPGPADQANFELNALASDGSSLWQYELQDDISWAGNTMIVEDQVVFLAQIAPAIFPDPDGGEGSEDGKEGETRSFKDPAGTMLAGSIPQNVLIAVSLANGQELWRQEISGFVSTVQKGPAGRIYVSYLRVNAFDGLDEQLTVFDAAGQNLWDVTTKPAEFAAPLPDK